MLLWLAEFCQANCKPEKFGIVLYLTLNVLTVTQTVIFLTLLIQLFTLVAPHFTRHSCIPVCPHFTSSHTAVTKSDTTICIVTLFVIVIYL